MAAEGFVMAAMRRRLAAHFRSRQLDRRRGRRHVRLNDALASVSPSGDCSTASPGAIPPGVLILKVLWRFDKLERMKVEIIPQQRHCLFVPTWPIAV
jgi:hypothetical protein